MISAGTVHHLPHSVSSSPSGQSLSPSHTQFLGMQRMPSKAVLQENVSGGHFPGTHKTRERIQHGYNSLKRLRTLYNTYNSFKATLGISAQKTSPSNTRNKKERRTVRCEIVTLSSCIQSMKISMQVCE